MSESTAAYLASDYEPYVQEAARKLAAALIGQLRLGRNHVPGRPVDVSLRLSLTPEMGTIVSWAHMDVEYTCHIDGFGPYREKLHRSIAREDMELFHASADDLSPNVQPRQPGQL